MQRSSKTERESGVRAPPQLQLAKGGNQGEEWYGREISAHSGYGRQQKRCTQGERQQVAQLRVQGRCPLEVCSLCRTPQICFGRKGFSVPLRRPTDCVMNACSCDNLFTTRLPHAGRMMGREGYQHPYEPLPHHQHPAQHRGQHLQRPQALQGSGSHPVLAPLHQVVEQRPSSTPQSRPLA